MYKRSGRIFFELFTQYFHSNGCLFALCLQWMSATSTELWMCTHTAHIDSRVEAANGTNIHSDRHTNDLPNNKQQRNKTNVYETFQYNTKMDCYCIQRTVTHSRTPYTHGQSKTPDINYSRDIKTKTYSLIRVALEYERNRERRKNAAEYRKDS